MNEILASTRWLFIFNKLIKEISLLDLMTLFVHHYRSIFHFAAIFEE